MMRIVKLMKNRFVCNAGPCVYMLTVPFWAFERFYSPLRVETDKVLLFLRACIFAVILSALLPSSAESVFVPFLSRSANSSQRRRDRREVSIAERDLFHGVISVAPYDVPK